MSSLFELTVRHFTCKNFDRFLEKKPFHEEYFGSTFPSSNKRSLMLMSISKGLFGNPHESGGIVQTFEFSRFHNFGTYFEMNFAFNVSS